MYMFLSSLITYVYGVKMYVNSESKMAALHTEMILIITLIKSVKSAELAYFYNNRLYNWLYCSKSFIFCIDQIYNNCNIFKIIYKHIIFFMRITYFLFIKSWTLLKNKSKKFEPATKLYITKY